MKENTKDLVIVFSLIVILTSIPLIFFPGSNITGAFTFEGSTYEITKGLNPSGTSQNSGDTYSLESTAGQSVVGTTSSSSFEIKSGRFSEPYIKSTEFNGTTFENTNLDNIQNLVLENKYGRITYLNTTYLSEGVSLDKHIIIDEKHIGVNSTKLKGLDNTPVKIEIFNVNCGNKNTLFVQENFQKDRKQTLQNIRCDSSTNPSCTQKTCSSNTYSFKASHTSSFALKSKSPSQPSTSSGGGGGGGGSAGRSVCEQKWNCTSWSICQPDGTQTRECTDANKCREKNDVILVNNPRPPEERSCEYTATCSDGIKNGDETGIDCGGSCSQGCEINKSCNIDADCATNNCLDNTCVKESIECTTNEHCKASRQCQNNKCVTDTEERVPDPTQPTEPETTFLASVTEETLEFSQKMYQKTKSLLIKVDNTLRALDAWIFNNLEKAAEKTINVIIEGVQSLAQTLNEKSDEVIGATILSLITIILLITGYYTYKKFKEIEIKEKTSKTSEKISMPTLGITGSLTTIKNKIKSLIKKNRAKTTAKELNKFIKESILEEKTKEEIKQKLQDKGWPEDLVNDYVNHFYKENKELIQKIKEKREKESYEQELKELEEELKKL